MLTDTLVHDWILKLRKECITLAAEHAGRRLRWSTQVRDWLPAPSHRAHCQRSTCGEQDDDRRNSQTIAPDVSTVLSPACLFHNTTQQSCTVKGTHH